MTLYPEPAVSRVSGIRKGLLADTRRTACVKGQDWALENNVVCYTADGLKKICSALKLDLAGLEDGLQDEARPASPATGPGPAEAPAAATEASTPTISPPDQGAGQHALNPTIPEPPPVPASTPAPEDPGATEKNPPEGRDQAAGVIGRGVARAAGEELVEVTLTAVPVNGNKRLLYGTIEDPKERSGRRRVSVRVRDNANFLKGFVVQATPAGPNYYNFVGRLPRWRGDRLGFTAKPKEPRAGTA
jgi:hypothetical protein